LYRKAHAFVLASFETSSGEAEGQSVVVLEAQSTGLPVIAATTGGVPEGLINNVSGILVPPRDAGALARAILRLAQHPESWDVFGKAGRTYVEANFDQEKLLDRLIGIYERIQSADRPQGAGKIS
jgi:colanic acid/amylovoran biosynthesis glycosyltransferase